MSLPFAGPPEESQIYTDLKGVVLADLTADQFDQLRERLFSEGVNGTEDEYRRLRLLGQAAQKISSSGPIPGSDSVISVNSDTNNAIIKIKEPSKGEVWQLSSGSWTGSGISGTICYYLLAANQSSNIDAGTDRSAASILVEYCATAGNGVLNEETPFGEIYVGENTGLYVQAVGTFSDIDFKFLMNRVR
jgi:hypothetical protein